MKRNKLSQKNLCDLVTCHLDMFDVETNSAKYLKTRGESIVERDNNTGFIMLSWRKLHVTKNIS